MDNKTISVIAILAIGGFVAYTVYNKKKEDDFSGGYTPSRRPSAPSRPTSGGQVVSKADKGGKFDIQKAMNLLQNLYNTGNFIYLTATKKKRAAEDLKKQVDAGKNQQQIEIYMRNTYNLNSSEVSAMLNKLYA